MNAFDVRGGSRFGSYDYISYQRRTSTAPYAGCECS